MRWSGSHAAMCGRFALHASPERVAELLSLDEIEDFPPRYNIAPTQPILLVIGGAEARPEANRAGRSALLARWGLIPSWVKDASKFPLLINARAETAATKNSFRAAMTYRRCLIPATEFYEWRRTGSGPAKPFLFRPASAQPFAFAGLLETAHGPDGGELDTAAIVTTSAEGALTEIHNRMPVVVEEPDYERWLDCRTNAPGAVADIVATSAAKDFAILPVGTAVNKVANSGPEVQAPIGRPAIVETNAQDMSARKRRETGKAGAGESAPSPKDDGEGQLKLF
nr:SOS response-associated peptidase [Fulvimarina manganoxydans]